VTLGKVALVAECIATGDVEEREYGIKLHYHWHSEGVMFVYTNPTTDKKLEEKLWFKL
jgi:hypothetical protein